MLNYRTDYSNQVHQLSVAVSKHFYLGKDGLLKYQKKKMEISLSKAIESGRRHMITIIIRDHFSGLFHAEATFLPELPDIYGFISRMSVKRSERSFYGLPEIMIISSNVSMLAPNLVEDFAIFDVDVMAAENGFHGGVRDFRTVEETLRFYAIGGPPENVNKVFLYTCDSHADNKRKGARYTKIETWKLGLNGSKPRSFTDYMETP